MESRIQEIVVCGIGNPGFWKTEYSSRNPESTNDCNRGNPFDNFHWQRIWNPVSGIRNPRRGIQNPRLPWIPLLLGAIYKWYPIDFNDISPGKFYPNQNTNLNNFRTRGFLWKNGKVGERNWWVPKNWKSEKKVNLMLLLCVFRWRHGGHICVPKQWYDGHVYVLNQPCGSWTLFLCKRFLLFQ